jgi:hypothetical protein
MPSDEKKVATILKRLQDVAGSIWIGDSLGYGSAGTLFMIGDDGLYTTASMSEPLWDECRMTKEECDEAKAIIAAGGDEYDHDHADDPVVMVQNDCVPEKTYYVLWDEFHGHPDINYFESLDEALGCLDFEWVLLDEWGDMDISELEKWVRVAGYLKKGIRSVYEIKS